MVLTKKSSNNKALFDLRLFSYYDELTRTGYGGSSTNQGCGGGANAAGCSANGNCSVNQAVCFNEPS